MIWYRWAFYYDGGTGCGCTGLLGRLLHVSKANENAIPIVTLGFITFTTIPWLIQIVKNIMKRGTINVLPLAVIIAVLLSGGNSIKAAQVIRLQGTMELGDYNYMTGEPTGKWSNTFLVEISKDAWSCAVTNIDRPRWWARMSYDGTNSYIIEPSAAWGRYATNDDQLPSADSQVVLIDRSPQFLRKDDEMGLSIVWFTYGLTRSIVHSNNMGLVDMPLPTGGARDNPRCYGFKWLINYCEDGTYVKHCDIVRDSSLDLSEAEEMLRPALDYPRSQAEYNQYRQLIEIRNGTPNGFVKCRYDGSNWIRTNGVMLPTASELDTCWWDIKHGIAPHPWRIFTLKVATISVLENQEEGGLVPKITLPTQVEDYRYKRTNESREFRFAEYSLNVGDSWKSDKDVALLAKAEDYLQHGPKYGEWTNRERQWVAWAWLAFLFLPLLTLLLRNRKNKQPKQPIQPT
ncbi:MAG TPA: hypothetical protein VFC07_08600 [Verrucomicrobiae bacterium]|nr:hypothetical protein [Verrucomicrobiae bacterium]